MVKLVVMYVWPRDPDQFRRYYLEHHLPLCRAIPGSLRVHYTFEPQTVQGEARWFCIYEAEYADQDALRAALASPECKRAADDVPNFSEVSPVGLIYEATPLAA